MGRSVNGWQINTQTMGVYGTNYLQRAVIAMGGLGANLPEDAVYPLLLSDSDGKLSMAAIDAFWSLTVYDQNGHHIANPIHRYAIGDRDDLGYNQDGSLDLHIQPENPGTEKERNWLPSSPKGSLGMTMRLYSPRPEVIDGRWAPPAVKRVG